jgi:hypothetical protein
MDEEMRRTAADLRATPSKEAADWLMARYPVGTSEWGKALILLNHVSVRKADLRRLACHYLNRAPYAQDRPYRVFAKLLGLKELLAVLAERPPSNEPDTNLLLYHLRPILGSAETADDCRAVTEFMAVLARH